MKTWVDSPNGIKSTATAFDIIESVQDRQGATLGEIVEDVGVTKSTVHCHLGTLMERGYIRQQEDRYQIGLLFLHLGTDARDTVVPNDHIEAGVRRVAEELQEKAQFSVEEYGRGYALFRERGTYGIRTGRRIGAPMSLHDNAAGKAILAELPHERVQEIIDHWGLPATTENAITDPDVLFEELAEIRETSIAYNRGESREDLRALGCSIKKGDEVIGAISASGPKHRMTGEKEEETKDIILGIVNEIELNFGEE